MKTELLDALRDSDKPASDAQLEHWLVCCEAKTRIEKAMAARIAEYEDERLAVEDEAALSDD